MSFRLADLITPQSTEEFLHETYAQSWIRHKGAEGRFASLMNWADVNSILDNQQFESPRFRLGLEGKIIPPDVYTEKINRRDNAPYRRIAVDRFLDQLRNGATLTIDRVEEAHRPIRDLVAALRAELKAEVSAVIFASWAPVTGFGLHWDAEDVFVIQLDGRKHWEIHEPTLLWPRPRDAAVIPKPEGSPLAEFDMSPGDVMYLPQGWWHAVTASEEPSLHLALTVTPNNGIDLANWLVSRTKSHEIFRRRIPRFADEREKRAHRESIQAAWNELMSGDQILDQYLTYADGMSGALPSFDLPNVLIRDDVLDNRERRLVLVAPRAAIAENDEGFLFTALGRRWLFSSSVKPFLDLVISEGSISVRQAFEVDPDAEEKQVSDAIFILLKAGVLAYR